MFNVFLSYEVTLPEPFCEPFLFFIAFWRISFMETFRLSTGINEKPWAAFLQGKKHRKKLTLYTCDAVNRGLGSKSVSTGGNSSWRGHRPHGGEPAAPQWLAGLNEWYSQCAAGLVLCVCGWSKTTLCDCGKSGQDFGAWSKLRLSTRKNISFPKKQHNFSVCDCNHDSAVPQEHKRYATESTWCWSVASSIFGPAASSLAQRLQLVLSITAIELMGLWSYPHSLLPTCQAQPPTVRAKPPGDRNHQSSL